jgi:hypothetical protein
MPEFLFWDGERECPGVPHRGHTKSGNPCPLEDRDAGSMHEPKPYTGDLDWDDDPVLHPFVD